MLAAEIARIVVLDPELASISGLNPPAAPKNPKGAMTVIATLPVKPFVLVTVIVVVFAHTRATFMKDGFAVRVKPGPANTVNVNWILCVLVPKVLVTVIGTLTDGALGEDELLS